MRLSPEQLEELRKVAPEMAAKLEADEAAFQAKLEEEDPVPPPEPSQQFASITGGIIVEGDGERDQDPVQRGCPACERGALRRGAPHTCGRPGTNVGDRLRW